MKKCLVLDLDNTLWGGVVGEEGIRGLALGLTPPGSGFLAFQQSILDLHNRGVILAINSKNNFNDAMEAIRTHQNMILKEKHFAAARINWNDKAENMRSIAKELNVGLDSFVFLDDDPINRALLRVSLPEVETPELPSDPMQYARFLMSLPYFDGSVITDEDKLRGNFYVTERLRGEAEKQFSSREEFLSSLEIEVHVSCDDTSAVPRLAQLTAKTNQFNTNKTSLEEEAIRCFINNPNYAVFQASARDKFGDHGIIAFALIEKEFSVWKIVSLLLSCRVLGKGIEEAFLEAIVNEARNANAARCLIDFKKSEKNQPAEEFVQKYFKNCELNINQGKLAPPWVTLRRHEPPLLNY